MSDEKVFKESMLGKDIDYDRVYNASVLYSIPRDRKRIELATSKNQFHGFDYWTAWEISWLNLKGKPQVAIGRFVIPCESKNIIESKSIKLYLNGFNQEKYPSIKNVQQLIKKDLSDAAGSEVEVSLNKPDEWKFFNFTEPQGICIDDQDIMIKEYMLKPDFLETGEEIVEETVYSNLLKSNCPVTGQPDWATIFVKYHGKKIDQAGLLKYFVSYRNNMEFHEHCVERIFMDIMRNCSPEKLTVYAMYTRRGGLDINPFRSNFERIAFGQRLIRQ